MVVYVFKSALCLLLQKPVKVSVVMECGMTRRAEVDGQTIVVCRFPVYAVEHMMHLHLPVTGTYVAPVWFITFNH